MKRFTFLALGSVRRAGKTSNSPEVLDRHPERYCISTKVMFIKCKGQCRVTEGHYKIKVTNMLCDASFLGYFASRYRWWQSFDPMTSCNLTFDGGRVKDRSNKVKFSNQYFTQKTHISCSEFPQDSKYAISFLLRCVERRKTASQKRRYRFFAI